MTLKQAEYQLRYFQKKVKELRAQQVSEISEISEISEKESEKGEEEEKRNFPPDPLYRKEGEEEPKEKEALSLPRVRAKENRHVADAVIDVHRPPTLEKLLAWAKSNNFTDEKIIRDWYNEMTNVLYWCHPKSGAPISHWPAFFRRCYCDAVKNSTKGTNNGNKSRHYQPTANNACKSDEVDGLF